MLPRGIRNNNPLNIRRSKDQWQGLRAQQTDSQFCQFETLVYGWRAAFVLLTRTYYHKYRLYTIRMIINKWAPPNENLTATYIQNVSRLTGIAPDEPPDGYRPRRAYRHPVGSAPALDDARRGDGDSGKWNRFVRLLRHAARVGRSEKHVIRGRFR